MGQLDWLDRRVREHGDRIALNAQFGTRVESLTYAELGEHGSSIGGRMRLSGIGVGDRVAILSESRPRWALALFAIWRANAIAVPLDARLEEQELLHLLRDAAPALIVVSGELREVAQRLAAAVSPECRIACFDDAADPLFVGDAMDCVRAMEPRRTECPDEQVALILYTSGTAGPAKGVMLTHANLRFQLTAGSSVFDNGAETVAVSILPLNHVFELTAGLLGVLYVGGCVCYCRSLLPDEIQATLRRERPTAMAVVPLFLNLIKKGIERGVSASPVWQQRVFAITHALARRLPGYRLRRLLFRRLHQRFGGRLEFFISGGAPLAAEVVDYFAGLGLCVYQGYGLTETAPVIATNAPRATRTGSVGRPLPGVQVRCLDGGANSATGEICTRGPHVMTGYFRRPDLTAAAIDADGWLRTGDLGHIDADGYLYVTGRCDNLIVLGNGKKVSPEDVEDCLQAEPGFKEVVVIGRTVRHGVHAGSAEVCVVVVPADLLDDRHRGDADGLQRDVVEAVRRRAANLAAFKRPTRVVVRTDELPKTTTRKVKRAQVGDWLTELESSDAAVGA